MSSDRGFVVSTPYPGLYCTHGVGWEAGGNGVGLGRDYHPVIIYLFQISCLISPSVYSDRSGLLFKFSHVYNHR